MLVSALGAGTVAPGHPPENPGQPGCLPGDALENENVRIWFQGLKGHVKVFDNSSEEEEGLYTYNTGAVVETDADGNPVAEMNLGRAFPQTSDCEVEETEEYVNLTLTITDNVRETNGGFIGEATVTFAYNFNKSENGAKFDLDIVDWPWQADGELNYEFTVQSTWEMEVAENGIGFENETGEDKGHIEWAENATVTYENGTQDESDVVADWNQTEGKVDVSLAFTNVTAGYVELEYDPWASMGDWIIILDRLYSLDALEAVLPSGLYRTVRGLIW